LARPPAGKGVPELPPGAGRGPEKEPGKERLVREGAAMASDGGAGGAGIDAEVKSSGKRRERERGKLLGCDVASYTVPATTTSQSGRGDGSK
jgi:hypothetical protein